MTKRSTPLTRIRDAYSEFLYIDEYNMSACDYLAAVMLATRWVLDFIQLWGLFTGASSVGKTEMIRPLLRLSWHFAVDSISENALVSGWTSEEELKKGKKSKDSSVVLQLDQKTWIIKDFASMMAHDHKAAAKIYGDLRGAHDGSLVKAFGTGTKGGQSRFGLLAAAVPSVDAFEAEYNFLGTRFLQYKLDVSLESRYRQAMKAIEDFGTDDVWRETLGVRVATELERLGNVLHEASENKHSSKSAFETIRILSRAHLKYAEELKIISTVTGRARAVPRPSNPTSTMRGTAFHESESPGRMVKELMALGTSRCVLDDRTVWNDEDLKLVARVGWDTMSAYAQKVLAALWSGVSMTTSDVAYAMHASGDPSYTKALLHAFSRPEVAIVKMGRGTHLTWSLNPEFRARLHSVHGSSPPGWKAATIEADTTDQSGEVR